MVCRISVDQATANHTLYNSFANDTKNSQPQTIKKDSTWHLTVQWYFGNIPCKLCMLLKQFSMAWNSFAVFVIGLERTVSLLKPMAHGSSKKRAILLIVPSMALALFGCLPR
jgi:hypothetical protein